MILKNYKCIWHDKDCSSSKYIKIRNNKKNFYTDYIENELLSSSKEKKIYKKIKTYFCKNCKCVYNIPWFDNATSRKIYLNTYGQQHKGWTQILDFISKKNKTYHGNLLKNIISKLKIKKYAEYNRPLTGIYSEITYGNNSKFKYLKQFFNSIIELNYTKQVAGKIQKNINQTKKLYRKKFFEYDSLKKKLLNRSLNKNYLIIDNSPVSWSENDNYKSINSRALARDFFNLNILSVDELKKEKLYFDLFGFFLSLDHSSDPKKILDLALNRSKYVIIHSHINPQVTKQHFFSITSQFPEFLNKKNIYVKNITDLVI